MSNEINKNETNLKNGMAHPLGEKAQSFGQSLEKASIKIGDEVSSIAKNVSAKTSGYLETTRDYVEENPIQSMAMAAATGIAVGSLLSYVSRSK